eukprot:gene4972-5213_t
MKAVDNLEWQTPLAIIRYPDPRLRAVNAKIGVFDDKLRQLAKQMLEVMYQDDGVGLAAPQIGVNVRLMVFNETAERGHPAETVLVNPVILEKSRATNIDEEGCLSFPKIYADVERANKIDIQYQDLDGNTQQMQLRDFEARVFQHEYDHLQGVLFHDRMKPTEVEKVRQQLVALEEAFTAANPKVQVQRLPPPGACPPDQVSRVLVLDDVQQLLSASDSPLPALLALREQTGANISLLLVSRVQPSTVGLLSLLPGVVPVAFPAYTDAQLIGPPEASGAASGSSPAAMDLNSLRPVYRHFLTTMVVPEFKRLSRCLPDIISQVAALWPRYLAGAQQQQQQPPAAAGAVSEDQVGEEVEQQARRFAAVQHKMQSALRSFQPAACCTMASLATTSAGQQQQQVVVVVGMSGAHMAAGLELCRLGKLLLVAAFLASRNKASVDKQLFSGGQGWRGRRGGRRGNAMGADRQAEAAKAAELKGPHTFSLSRLFAVYGSLLAADDDSSALGSANLVEQQQQDQQQQQGRLLGQGAGAGWAVPGAGWLGVQRADVMTGISSLVACKLLSQACDDLLEAPRFGCEAPRELVEQLALDLGLPLSSYLKYI